MSVVVGFKDFIDLSFVLFELLQAESYFMKVNQLCSFHSTVKFGNKDDSGQGPRPPQRHDDERSSSSGDSSGSGNDNNNDKKKNDDDDKLSALLIKAFLWMLTAYMFIAVVSLVFPGTNQPEV